MHPDPVRLPVPARFRLGTLLGLRLHPGSGPIRIWFGFVVSTPRSTSSPTPRSTGSSTGSRGSDIRSPRGAFPRSTTRERGSPAGLRSPGRSLAYTRNLLWSSSGVAQDVGAHRRLHARQHGLPSIPPPLLNMLRRSAWTDMNMGIIYLTSSVIRRTSFDVPQPPRPCAATSNQRSSTSMPVNLRPRRSAATPVVPEPMKGSRSRRAFPSGRDTRA